MHITFIIGNGFDLQNKFQTTFENFFNTISKEKKETNYIYKAYNDTNILKNALHKGNLKDNDNSELNRVERGINEKNEEVNWADFEKCLGILTNLVNEDINSSNISAPDFITDLRQLKSDFKKYLEEQTNQFIVSQENQKKAITTTLSSFYKNLEENHRKKIVELLKLYSNLDINFINFNYTQTLDAMIESLIGTTLKTPSGIIKNDYKYYKINNPINIHRTLNTGSFLGVNDISQLNPEPFDNLSLNTLIKPNSNIGYNDSLVLRAENMIKRSSIIYIFGMSLGATDKVWWQKIGNWLKISKNNYLIINSYELKFKNQNPQEDPYLYFSLIKDKQDEFLRHVTSKNDREAIRNQIFISFNTPYFFIT